MNDDKPLSQDARLAWFRHEIRNSLNVLTGSLKLLEMGCIPGAQIKLNSKAPFGCPITVVVNDYILSLRLEEAETIELT